MKYGIMIEMTKRQDYWEQAVDMQVCWLNIHQHMHSVHNMAEQRMYFTKDRNI